MTLLTQTDDDLTLLCVKQALLDEEQRRQKPRENDFTAENSFSALKAAYNKVISNKQKLGTSTCCNCGQSSYFV